MSADRGAAPPPARAGARVIGNPVSGEQITIRAAAGPGDPVLEWELLLAPGGKVPSRHARAGQEECFTILDGRMRCRVGRRRITAGPGTCVRILPGRVHHFANASDRPARVAVRATPALAMADLLETAAALAAARHAAGRRLPSPRPAQAGLGFRAAGLSPREPACGR